MRLTVQIGAMAAILISIGHGVAAGQVEEAGWSDRVPKIEGARHHYASPQGRPENAGTRESPWDLASALNGRQKVAPGDVVWVRGGQYRGENARLLVGLAGKEGAPIHVRAVPGERATILDSEVTSVDSAADVWLWDLEITSSATPKEQLATPADAPGNIGLYFRWGKGCKFINLAVHNNPRGGFAWWTEAGEGEIHGCLIYGNGLRPDAPRHGHCVYTQNRDGVKTISNCIMSVPAGDPFTLYAYGTERAWIDNFLIEDNIFYERGTVLIGGGRPSHNIRVLRNYLHGVDMQIGFTTGNEDCEVRDNVIVGGELKINNFKTVVDKGNLRNLPEGGLAILTPNKYDPSRAHLAMYTGTKPVGATAADRRIRVDVPEFLKPGEAYRVLDPKNPFGEPLLEGKCEAGTITIPMKGEFEAFVIIKVKGKS